MGTIERPILRYFGGKFLSAPWIIGYFPEHTIYTEAYGGGGSVLLRKPRAFSEVYNDIDGEIVNLFRVLRDRGSELAEKLRLTPFAREEFVLSYDKSEDPVEQARRTLARSFMGFGSDASSRAKTGFRGYSNGYGRSTAQDWASYPDHVHRICERLSGITIERCEARKIIEKYDTPDTLHYVDPPYPHSTRQATTVRTSKGYLFELSDDDHRELADVLHSRVGMVVVSGYACDMYDMELYQDWTRFERPYWADGALKRIEVLWLNTPAASRLKQQSMNFEPAHV